MSYVVGLDEFRKLKGIPRACLITRKSLRELFDEIREAYRQAYKGIDGDSEPFVEYAQRRISEIAGHGNDAEDDEEGRAIREYHQQGHHPVGD
jgi:hypothetical protein